MGIQFKDRTDAGKQLAHALQVYAGAKDTLVVGLARGGVVVAFHVAAALHLPLDVVVVRKIGAPGNEELAIGAVSEEGEPLFNESLIAVLSVSTEYLTREAHKQQQLVQERSRLYREGRPPYDFKNQTVILVDDGLATGASMRAAIRAVRSAGAHAVILAVPVAASTSLESIEADRRICLHTPLFFASVSNFYKSFEQTSDEEVIRLIRTAT